MERRSFLAALGVAGAAGLAGCGSLSDSRPPAGSLVFENNDDLPHVVGVEVEAVGAEPTTDDDGYAVSGEVTVPKPQRDLQASASVAPGETQTFESVFTEPAAYLVAFSVDGSVGEHGRTAFSPTPGGRDRYNFVRGVVDPAGSISWVVSKTDDSGPFDG